MPFSQYLYCADKTCIHIQADSCGLHSLLYIVYGRSLFKIQKLYVISLTLQVKIDIYNKSMNNTDTWI